LKDSDAVVGVDYFGHPPGEGFRALKAAHPRPLWIEDRAQALDAGPAWGDAVIWSARKLVGVGDGGVMVSQGPLPEPDLPALDLWAAEDARAGDPEGRAPETWRPLFQAREAAMPLAPHAMNERTQAALKTVDAAAIAGARRTNWRRLAAALADMALWPIAEPDFVPLAFPIRVPDAAAAVQALAAHRIWAPRHWPELPSGAGEDALALSRRLVSLPLDQRYGEADMDRVIAAVRTI
ncbi:MAG TPA: hypothetical protein VG939_05530, partial [Caulobacteraceae bacterium]|nr:hypothetical protein [Caulobacteraceae bacterium]